MLNEPRTKSDAYLPEQLHFTFTGAASQFFQIELESSALVLRSGSSGVPTSSQVFSPSPDNWKQFRHSLDAAQVWDWEPRYESGEVSGPHWELRIRYGARAVSSCGTNAYPGSEGASYDSTSPFAILLRALSRLTGQRIS